MRVDIAKLRELAKSPRHALEIGKAAEHLVCADLTLQGYRCYLTDQGLPYDILVDVSGVFHRIQVKAACFPRNTKAKGRSEAICYSFSVRRIGKKGWRRLSDDDCDIVALVALDIQAIAYLPINAAGTTCQLMRPDHHFRGRYKRRHPKPITEFPFAAALRGSDPK